MKNCFHKWLVQLVSLCIGNYSIGPVDFFLSINYWILIYKIVWRRTQIFEIIPTLLKVSCFVFSLLGVLFVFSSILSTYLKPLHTEFVLLHSWYISHEIREYDVKHLLSLKYTLVMQLVFQLSSGRFSYFHNICIFGLHQSSL